MFAWKCCPRPNQAMSLSSFLQGTAARSGNCCIFALLLLGMASISSIISTCSTNFTCFDASNVWIAWQVRLPGGELEDALVPCDSAQGVVPLTAILASWKYWGRVLQSGVFYQECLPLPVDLPWNVANAIHETHLQIHILTDPADGTMDWALPRYCATNSMRSSHGCRLGVTLQSS